MAAAGLLAALGLFAGCSDDEDGGGVVGPPASAITVSEILFNPGAIQPADTLLVTAVILSDTPNVGDFVTYEWTKTGGEWIDATTTDKSSVRWRAPANQPGMYRFTVTARNSSSSSTLSADVYVGSLDLFIPERAGQIFVVPGTDAVYYASGPGEPEDGFALRFKDAATDEVAFPNHRGNQFSFDKSGSREAHTYIETTLYTKTTVVFDDLVARTHKTIARDERTFAVRWGAYTDPYVSLDGKFVAYQGRLLDNATPAQGGVDTFAVFVYEVDSERTWRGTFRGKPIAEQVSTSFYPTMSSDNRHVVFISDRGGSGIWEYYALPMGSTGLVPDTIPDALVKLTNTGGKVTSESPIPARVSARQWCPDPANPTLATVGADKKLRLVRTNGTEAVEVALNGAVDDVRWADNGAFLAASVVGGDNVSRIYRITPSGDASQVLWAAPVAGDRIRDLSISPDGGAMVYLARRGQKAWYEFIETTRTVDDPPAVRITPSLPVSGAADYGPPLQSFRPAWATTSARVAYLVLQDKNTPRVVVSRDLSAIGD